MKTLDWLQWERNLVIFHAVKNIETRVKRAIFLQLRDSKTTADTLLLPLGITAGEFAVFHLLDDSKDKDKLPNQ